MYGINEYAITHILEKITQKLWYMPGTDEVSFPRKILASFCNLKLHSTAIRRHHKQFRLMVRIY
jgi:hypothetical protein